MFYDQLLLWLLPRTPREMLAMVEPSWLAYLGAAIWPAGSAALAITLICGCALALVQWHTESIATIPHPERI